MYTVSTTIYNMNVLADTCKKVFLLMYEIRKSHLIVFDSDQNT